MGVVKFWRTEKLTPVMDPPTATAEVTPPPKPVSLDALVADIRHCRSRVVHLEGEMARAQLAEEDAKKNFIAAIQRLDEEIAAFREHGNADDR